MAKKRLDLPFIYIPLILMNEISIKSQKRRSKKIKKNQIKKMMPPLLTRLTYAIEYLLEIPKNLLFWLFLFKIDSVQVIPTIL